MSQLNSKDGEYENEQMEDFVIDSDSEEEEFDLIHSLV